MMTALAKVFAVARADTTLRALLKFDKAALLKHAQLTAAKANRSPAGTIA